MDMSRLVADAILSAAADAVVATDPDGIIHVWNPGAERIFGVGPIKQCRSSVPPHLLEITPPQDGRADR